jgi:hypothetical protein
MANAKVSLLRYVKTSRGWRRCRVEEESTRKGRGWTTDWDDPKSYGPDVEAVGDYQLKWYDGGNAKYACAGRDLREATIQRDKQASLLVAESAAEEAGVSLVEQDPTRKTLLLLKSEFIKQKEDVGRDRETISAYENLLSRFLHETGRRYPDQITESDVISFNAMLRDKGMSDPKNGKGRFKKGGLSDRSVANYYSNICTFLYYCGVDPKVLVKEEHRPKFHDPKPAFYSPDEIHRFMVALANEQHRLFFQFLLKTGCREREATHLEWDDIDLGRGKVNIQASKNLTLMVKGNVCQRSSENVVF